MKFSIALASLFSMISANDSSSSVELNSMSSNRRRLQLDIDEWLLERTDEVTATFADGTDPEVCLVYRIHPDKVTNLDVTIFSKDDKINPIPETDIKFVPDDDTSLTDTDGATLYQLCFDINENKIMGNSAVAVTPSSKSAEGYDVDFVFAPLVQLMFGEESVSFSKPIITIPTKLSADFTITDIGVATVNDDSVEQAATVAYAMTAFKCDANASPDLGPLPKNTPVRICIYPQSFEVKITKIISLTLTQSGTDVSRTRITDADTRDALTEDDVPIEGSAGISVITRIGSEFYENTLQTVTGTGIVELEFTSGTGAGIIRRDPTRRLAHFNFNNDRILQDEEGPQSSFGLEIGLEATVEESGSSRYSNTVIAFGLLLASLLL